MKSKTLFPLVLLVALAAASCQLPLTGSATGRLEVRNPYLKQANRGVNIPLVAFPQNLLTNLDHYVLRVLTTAGDPIASLPDQNVAPGSPVFSVNNILPGDYLLVVEAWSAGPVKTAESSQLITVTPGAVTTIDTLTLVPLPTGGDGLFSFTLSISSAFADLATNGKLSATLSQLNYSSGILSGVPTVLQSSLLSFVPSSVSLYFASTSVLPAGNYLITLQRASASIDAPAPVPVATILVQVFAGQTSGLESAFLSDSWLDAAPMAPPSGVKVERDPAGDYYVSWDAPQFHGNTAFYQIGYAYDEAALVPQASLSLVSGSGDSVAGAMIERTGFRMRAKVTPGTPPFNNGGDFQVAVFVRSVAGLAASSAWSVVTLNPTAVLRPRAIPALVFWDLIPGASYELQKRSSDLNVLASYDLTVGAADPVSAPTPTKFTFPGLSVLPGETLVLSRHEPDGTTIDTPLSLAAVEAMDGTMTYDPTAAYVVYRATRDPQVMAQDTWILLEDPDDPLVNPEALDPAATVTFSTVKGLELVWTASNLGGSHLARTGWTVETDSNARPERVVLAANAASLALAGAWDPQIGQITHYRVRSLYQYSFKSVLFEIVGPPSAWAGFDLEDPAVTIESRTPGDPGTIKNINELSVNFRYTDFQNWNDIPSYLTVSLYEWGNPNPLAVSDYYDNASEFVTTNGLISWTPVSWSGVTFTPGQSYQVEIYAADLVDNETVATFALKGGL